ncbi:hypothetical protein [Phaeobacter sp. Ax4a-4a]|uniref:hypothetical protein n=1 Tax=Phaeobacter sp. Ax4a-4a TaxID=3112437 RepID=UPI003A8C891F
MQIKTTVQMESQLAAQHLVGHLRESAPHPDAVATFSRVTVTYSHRDAGAVGESIAEFLINR